MPEKSRPAFAPDPIPRHLLRGVIGFGLLGSVFLLIPGLHLAALLLALPGLLAPRGPPLCWTAGLIETIAGARIFPACSGRSCMLRPPNPKRNGGMR